jgi:hypothetical protein
MKAGGRRPFNEDRKISSTLDTIRGRLQDDPMDSKELLFSTQACPTNLELSYSIRRAMGIRDEATMETANSVVPLGSEGKNTCKYRTLSISWQQHLSHNEMVDCFFLQLVSKHV